MKNKFIAVVVTAIISVVFAGSAMAQEINAYMGTSPDNNAKIAKFIKDKTGITVNQTFQSMGEIEARVKAEAPNFNADMIIGCASSTGFLAKKSGWSDPYLSPAWKGVPDVFLDPQAIGTTSPTFPSFWLATRTGWPRQVMPCPRAGRNSSIPNGKVRSSCPRP
jgi:ABC-type glycerol-3-phosphate transport system substrate-binding protein